MDISLTQLFSALDPAAMERIHQAERAERIRKEVNEDPTAREIFKMGMVDSIIDVSKRNDFSYGEILDIANRIKVKVEKLYREELLDEGEEWVKEETEEDKLRARKEALVDKLRELLELK